MITAIFACKVFSILKKYYLDNKNVEYKNIIAYPIVMMILWVPDLFSRVMSVILQERVFGYELIHVIVSRFVGLANAIVFGRKLIKRSKVEGPLAQRKHKGNNLTARLMEVGNGANLSLQAQ